MSLTETSLEPGRAFLIMASSSASEGCCCGGGEASEAAAEVEEVEKNRSTIVLSKPPRPLQAALRDSAARAAAIKEFIAVGEASAIGGRRKGERERTRNEERKFSILF